MRRILSLLILVPLLFTTINNVTVSAENVRNESISYWPIVSAGSISKGIIDRDIKASGTSSLKFVNESPPLPNVYLFAETYMRVRNGGHYAYSFKAKSQHTNRVSVMIDWTNRISLLPLGDSYDWTTFEYEYVHKTDAEYAHIQFVFDGVTEGFWIDDVTFYEVVDGKKVGENLINNSGFEVDGGAAKNEYSIVHDRITKSDSFSVDDINKAWGGFKYYPVLPAEEKISVDGNGDDWSNFPVAYIPILPNQYQMYNSVKPDAEAYAKVAFDNEKLYLYFEVTDKNYVFYDDPATYWMGDSIQICLGNKKKSYGSEIGFIHNTGTGKGSVFSSALSDKELSSINLKTSRQETKTRYEVSIPWDIEYGAKPEDFLFNFLYNDNDGNGRAYCVQLANGISEGKYNSQFPFFKLMEKPGLISWTKGADVAEVEVGSEYTADLYIVNYSDKESAAEIDVPITGIKKTITVAPKSGVREKIKFTPTTTDANQTIAGTFNGAPFTLPLQVRMTIPSIESAMIELKADLKELNKLLNRCEDKGISTDYERMNYKIIEKFIPYIKDDLDRNVHIRMKYTIEKLKKLYTEAKTSALSYLSGEKKPLAVPRYVTSPLEFDGKSVISTVSINGKETRQPVFLIGYGHFEQAQKDVPVFQSLGANILQTEIGPANVMNEKLEIDPARVQKWLTVLDQAAENNVSVSILLSPQYFPQWIVDQNPEIGNFHNWNMHVNIDYPIVREVLEKYLRGIIPLLKDHPALNSFCMTNEPVYQTHHTTYYKPHYQEFLRNKYGDINSLNTVYNTQYSGFDQIEMPQQIVENVWYYDWKIFNEKVNKEWHEWMAGIIREIAPEVPIHSKVIPLASFEDDKETRSYMSHGMNYDNFLNVSDILGTDGGNPIMSEEGYLGEYMGYDLMSSLKDGPVYNSEHHMIKDDTHVYSDEMAKHIETDVWQGAFHGRSMTTIWVWDRRDGGYAFLFGGSILYRPDCIQSVGTVNFDLNRLSAEATALQKVDPQVGILYSDASRVYSPAYMAHVYSAYQGILENGQKAGFVKESQIEKLSKYKMIIIPKGINIKKSTLDAVKKYADDGGKIIILGEDSLKKDELNRPHDTAIVNAIFEKAQIVPTQSEGIKVTAPTKKEIFGIFEEALKKYALSDIEVIDMATGEAVQNTEWLSIGYNGAILINAVNYEWDVPKTVQIRKNGKALTDITELRSGKKLTGNVTLSPKTPALLRCVEVGN